MSAIEDRIGRMVEDSLQSLGYELVRVQLSGSPGKRTLQIMAERADRAAMTVEDCAEISRLTSALLDVEDPIEGAYTLEVSSPGIDRPLTRAEHFARYAGFEARVEMAIALEGRKRFRGTIQGVENGAVVLTLDKSDEAVRLPVDGIARAKLVMTDALLEAARLEQEAAAEGSMMDVLGDDTDEDPGDDGDDGNPSDDWGDDDDPSDGPNNGRGA